MSAEDDNGVVEQELRLSVAEQRDFDRVLRFVLGLLTRMASDEDSAGRISCEFRVIHGTGQVLRLNLLYRDPIELRAALASLSVDDAVATLIVPFSEPDRRVLVHHKLGKLVIRGTPQFVSDVLALWENPNPQKRSKAQPTDDERAWLEHYDTHRFFNWALGRS